ncbi:lactate racemase domain-containing protein [Haloquadratum walsbyi]|jgi:hypothetical protein|uniref:LarA-like N-terminal domain-containing protein n=1 Tax=Haloquadratum walsbyi (strain DSM 16790 / HBSQ001) TaxID=362976 RepID=Q18FE5_HALWD|nr:lactate racemase domain-containing protein [Haloquadratum walsbyi]CAJ53312.1 uncharacterized protein HQ_3213A [Haloquadratum walsbyi DSM 16790]
MDTESDTDQTQPQDITLSFPDAETVEAALPTREIPSFAAVESHPETPVESDIIKATQYAVNNLSGPLSSVPAGGTIAVGLGSRGIHDIQTVAQVTIDELISRGYNPVVIPAMGSHGGATPAGQRQTLEEIGLNEETLGCSIDAGMETTVLGETTRGHNISFAQSAVDADGIIVINRIKPHTNFTGYIESGLSKMLTVGLGKQAGARTFHETALTNGYVDTIERALEIICDTVRVIGGIGIVENFHEQTAHIDGIPADKLPEAETSLLTRAESYLPTLPFDDLDVLIIEKIGKDISGAGMDTNVVGRYRVLNADNPDTPAISRIVVLGLTETTHGNGQGIGLADITTANVVSELDFEQTYTNALTSASVSKAHLPLVMPSERHAIQAALGTIGQYDPQTARIAWISDTSQLSQFHLSTGLLPGIEATDSLTIKQRMELCFTDDIARFDPLTDS